jgi:prevent-host-death family protein
MTSSYSLTEARAKLPLLLHRVADGEEITITRHGRPTAVLVSHDRWMKIAHLDVLDDVRQIRQHMADVRKRPVTEASFSVIPGYDAEAHIEWNREFEAERDDPWDRVRRERGES